ncbi:MAG: sensor histidine kinase [Bdellovibrionaceae bacterium]|nr:sensor histidine kinase [Pseudobdellovibrionaceae bacterium]
MKAYLFFVFSLLAFNFVYAAIEITSDTIRFNEIFNHAHVFIDPTSSRHVENELNLTQTLEKLEQLTPTDIKSVNGYKNAKVWLTFSVVNRSAVSDFVIRYSYPSMQYIDYMLYDNDGTLLTKSISGKLVPFEKRPIKDTDYLFPLKLDKDKIATIVMSFQSSGSMQLPIEILSMNRILELTQSKYLLFGLYYGVIFLILLYSLFLSITLKGPLYISYLFYVLSVVFSQMGLHGISFRYLWPELHSWNKVSTIFFVGLMFCSLAIFSAIALDLKNKSKLFFKVMIGFALIAASVSTFALFAYGSWVIKITGLITSILPLIIIPTGVIAWKRGHQFAPYYLAAVFFYLIGASLYGLKDSGLLDPSFITENGILLGSLIEICIFSLGIVKHIQRIQSKSERLKIELEKSKIFSQIASQVSHDIRSPLSALNLVVGNLSQIPEDKRIIIRSSVNRIVDIANQLLLKGKDIVQTQAVSQTQNVKSSPQNLNKLSVELLSPLIETIVSEKRIQFREKQRVEIEVDLSSGYGLFAEVDPRELKRALSNLITNAVEALPHESGKITISVKPQDDFIAINIQDNGSGIPEFVLKNLGMLGVTHGKEGTPSGSGLGVYHAKKITEEAGGQFKIQSQLGTGTIVTMSFHRASAPQWFVEKLVLTPGMEIILLDDDISIHQIWRGRFESKKISEQSIVYQSFTSGAELKKWFQNKIDAQAAISIQSPLLFLVDYELLGQSNTGLEIIEELGIQSNTVLVTSRYEEKSIRERCEKLGVKLIPKAMAGYVPIETTKPKILVDGILLDDDRLVHACWEFEAKNRGKKFVSFYTPKDFFEVSSQYDYTSKIYIDSNLGGGLKGEDIGKKAADIGFTNIYLCTGYQPSDFPPMSWIKGIVGKEPPF